MSTATTRDRLLMVVHSAKRQGAQNVALSHARALATDHDLLIAIGEGPLRGDFADLGLLLHEPSRAPIWGANVTRWIIDLGKAVPDTCRLALAVRRHRATAIIANSTVLVAPVLAARVARVPVIVCAHEAPTSPAARRLFGFHGRFADTVIAMSPWVADGFHSARARVIVSPPGIEIPPWQERAERVEGARLRLLLVGTIDRRKRQDIAIAALGRLRAAGVDAGLEIVGRAMDAGYGAELRELASGLGLSDRVEFTGEVPDVLDRMRSADIVLVPGGEVTPLVLMEAMAVGTPVVAASMGSIADVVEDDQSGLLFGPGDIEGLVAAITRISGDPGLAKRLASNGRARVEAKFDQTLSVETVRRELDLLRVATAADGARDYASSAS